MVLLCLCTFGLLWSVLGPVRGCESSSVSCGHLQGEVPGLSGGKIKEGLPQAYGEGGELEQRDWE